MIKKRLFVVLALLALFLIPSLTLAKVNLSLKVRGGLNYLQAGDVNPGSQGIFDLGKYYYNPSNGWSQTGGYKALHYGFDIGADLILQFNRHLGMSIGTGYLQSSKTSQATFSKSGAIAVTITTIPKLWALPVRLALFFTQHLGNKLNFTACAGGEFYPTAHFHLISNGLFWSTQRTYSEHRVGLGAVGSLGMEYKMYHKLAFFIEAQGRYARFNGGFKGVYKYWNSNFDFGTIPGNLYYHEDQFSGGVYRYFRNEETHTPAIPPNTVREAIIDFSGVSLQAGIRIHF